MLFALLIAGCGDGGSESAVETRTEAVETTDSPEATKRDCERLAETAQKFSTFLSGDFGAEEFQVDFAVFSFLTIVASVPDEIRDDLQVLDAAYFKYVDALAGVDPANLDRELQEKLTAEIDQQKVTQASQNIAAWVQANPNCT